MLSNIRDGDGKWLVPKELESVVRGLFYGIVQNCHGDADERHSVTLAHYLTDKDTGKVPASNHTTTTVCNFWYYLKGFVMQASYASWCLTLMVLHWSDCSKKGQVMGTTSLSRSETK